MKLFFIIVVSLVILGFYSQEIEGSSAAGLRTRFLQSSPETKGFNEERMLGLKLETAKLLHSNLFSTDSKNLPSSAFQDLNMLFRQEYRNGVESLITKCFEKQTTRFSLFSLLPKTISDGAIADKILSLEDQAFSRKLQQELIRYWVINNIKPANFVTELAAKGTRGRLTQRHFSLVKTYVQNYNIKSPDAPVSLYEMLSKHCTKSEFFIFMYEDKETPTAVISYIWPVGMTISYDDSLFRLWVKYLSDFTKFQQDKFRRSVAQMTISNLFFVYDPSHVLEFITHVGKSGVPDASALAGALKVGLLMELRHNYLSAEKFIQIFVTKGQNSKHLQRTITIPANCDRWVYMWLFYVKNDIKHKGEFETLLETLVNTQMRGQVLVTAMLFSNLQDDAKKLLRIQFKDNKIENSINIIANTPEIPSQFSWFSLLPENLGDAEIADTVLSLGKTNKDRSEQVETELIRYWVTTMKPIENVLKDFDMKHRDYVLSQGRLGMLENYVQKYNDVFKTEHSLYQILNQRYDDKQFFKCLDKGFLDADANHISPFVKLRASLYELTKYKINDMLEHPEEPATVLSYFERQQIVYKLPVPWILYLKAYSTKYDNRYKRTIVNLLNMYDDSTVVNLLDLVEKSDESDVANKLKLALREEWQRQGITRDQLRKRIDFTDSLTKSSPLVKMWLFYMKDDFTHHGDFIKYLDGLKPTLSDEDRLNILLASTTFHTMQYDANNELPKLIETYFQKQPNPSSALYLFNLDKRTLLTNPYFKQWIDYAIRYKPIDEKVSTYQYKRNEWIVVLQRYYGFAEIVDDFMKGLENLNTKEIAEKMKNAWFQWNLKDSRTAVYLVRQLGLNDVEAIPNILVQPKFRLWDSYAEATGSSTVECLLQVTSTANVVRMINTGLTHHDSYKLARKLQIELFDHWKSENVGLTQLNRMVKYDRDTRRILDDYEAET